MIGKYLDTSEINKIADETGLSLSIHAAVNTTMPDDVKKPAA